ncbi:MAG: N-acetyltransferase [Proteobacteria bacterium]|nr:MAG: N-acetyltransferase [Pseudomonadota bacterium]
MARGKWFQFAVELISESDLIGDIGFLNTDDEGRSWIGFTIDPKYWNQGYAAEAVVAVLNYYRDIGISKAGRPRIPKTKAQ